MFESMLYVWLSFGALLIVAEIILPGLVSIFVGLGAITVAALLHFGLIDDILMQLVVWFISSTVYIFTLRLAVMRFYPSDQTIQEIDEDKAMFGQKVLVTEDISGENGGRISYGDSTWIAISENKQNIVAGSKVEIVGRDNISWIVKKI